MLSTGREIVCFVFVFFVSFCALVVLVSRFPVPWFPRCSLKNLRCTDRHNVSSRLARSFLLRAHAGASHSTFSEPPATVSSDPLLLREAKQPEDENLNPLRVERERVVRSLAHKINRQEWIQKR